MQRVHRQPKIEVSSYKGKRLHIWVKVLLALVLAGVLAFLILLGQVMGGANDEIDGDPQVMVILGCQLHDWGPSIMLQDRLDKALEYLEENPGITVVVSGGQGPDEPDSEARGMADYLIEHGIPQETILLEARSHNTFQNLTYSAQLLEQMGVDGKEGIIIVSNGFHLTRAKMLAGRVGFEHISTLAAPSSHTPTRLKMYIREPLALVKSLVFDR